MRLADPQTDAGRLLRDRVSAHAARIEGAAAGHDHAGSFPTEVFEALRADGLLRATVPEELGGLGVRRLRDVCAALLCAARADASVALALHMQLSRGLTLSHDRGHGPPPVRAYAQRVLALMGGRGAVVCGAVSEPGRAAADPATELVPVDSGWLLRGRKSFVTLAPFASHFTVSARGPGEGGERVWSALVERSAPGVTVLGWDGLGMRASGSADVRFDDCPVATGDAVARGPVGDAGGSASLGRAFSSICLLGVYVGVADAARDLAVAGLTDRRQPVPAAARTLLAEVDARRYGMHAQVCAAVADVEEAAGSGTGADRAMAAFQYAKLAVNRGAVSVVDDCLTLVGGAAYGSSHRLARMYRDVRAGGFMQPFSYPDAIQLLSDLALTGARQ